MKVRAIAMVSGGLDSILAVKVLQDQGADVTGVLFETPFFNAREAKRVSGMLGIPLIIKDITADYLVMLKNPIYGFGKHMNPCIDCHTLMLNKAGQIMEEMGADFIVTGEVLGQRPMSQTKQSLYIVAKLSGYGEYVLRPLSAKLLPETVPEKEGKVDRNMLLDIQGRSRKRQIAMAKDYGIVNYTNPAGGCLLTDPMFSKRLEDLFKYEKNVKVRDIEALKYGRHFRLDDMTKIIVGRKKSENEALQKLSEARDTIIEIDDVPGPTVLIPYGSDNNNLRIAAAICALYSDAPSGTEVIACCSAGDTVQSIPITSLSREYARSLMI